MICFLQQSIEQSSGQTAVRLQRAKHSLLNYLRLVYIGPVKLGKLKGYSGLGHVIKLGIEASLLKWRQVILVIQSIR